MDGKIISSLVSLIILGLGKAEQEHKFIKPTSSEYTSPVLQCNTSLLSAPRTLLHVSLSVRIQLGSSWLHHFDEEAWLQNPTRPDQQTAESKTFLQLHFGGNLAAKLYLNVSSGLELSLNSALLATGISFVIGKWTTLMLMIDFDKTEVRVNVGNPKDEGTFYFPNLQDVGKILSDDFDKHAANKEDKNETLGEQLDLEMLLDDPKVMKICHPQNSSSDLLQVRHVQIFTVTPGELYPATLCNKSYGTGMSLVYEQETVDEETMRTMCKDQYSILHLNAPATYTEHINQCKKVQGSILESVDLIDYEEEISSILKASNPAQSVISWYGMNHETPKYESWCSVLLLNGSTDIQPCFNPLPISFCKVPASLQFHLFGRVDNFDRQYSLLVLGDGSIRLKGRLNSIVQPNGDKWQLRSNMHNDLCVTVEPAGSPLVRQLWNCGTLRVILAFSFCGFDAFICNSGQCLEQSSRCNGFVECDDKSDEARCNHIVEDPNYSDLESPPPLGEDGIFRLKYHFDVHSVAPVVTSDFFIEAHIGISIFWKDSRLTIWNPRDYLHIDCQNIWYPTFQAANGFPHGHLVPVPQLNTPGCAIVLDKRVPSTNSLDDPYMGRYLKGRDLELYHSFIGLFRIPCRFDLRSYPFGKQQCMLNIWIPIAEYQKLHFEKYSMDSASSDVPFFGLRDVREFFISRTWRKEENGNKSATLIFEMKSIYGYHIMNSYLTSLLIILISFATFLFRVEDFNERIMVSLTTLLVLAALYTQSNSTSVRTPYLKLLDLWYAALIAFCFAIVISNTFLNSCYHRYVKEVKDGKKVLENWMILKKVQTLNRIVLALLVATFIVFIVFYVSTAIIAM